MGVAHLRGQDELVGQDAAADEPVVAVPFNEFEKYGADNVGGKDLQMQLRLALGIAGLAVDQDTGLLQPGNILAMAG